MAVDMRIFVRTIPQAEACGMAQQNTDRRVSLPVWPCI